MAEPRTDFCKIQRRHLDVGENHCGSCIGEWSADDDWDTLQGLPAGCLAEEYDEGEF